MPLSMYSGKVLTTYSSTMALKHEFQRSLLVSNGLWIINSSCVDFNEVLSPVYSRLACFRLWKKRFFYNLYGDCFNVIIFPGLIDLISPSTLREVIFSIPIRADNPYSIPQRTYIGSLTLPVYKLLINVLVFVLALKAQDPICNFALRIILIKPHRDSIFL